MLKSETTETDNPDSTEGYIEIQTSIIADIKDENSPHPFALAVRAFYLELFEKKASTETRSINPND